MTWKLALPLAFGIAATAAVIHAPSSAETGIVMPETLPVSLDPNDADNVKLGELIYRGGLEIEPGDLEIGGISGLEWYDGQFVGVMDDGRWLTIETDEIRGTLVDLIEIEVGALNDERGKRLRGKGSSDAEAITRAGDGGWLVSFEQDHRVWRYVDLNGTAEAAAYDAVAHVANAPSNSGLETLAVTSDGYLACGEWASEPTANCMLKTSNGLVNFELEPPAPLNERGGVPTDADCASNGVCFVLFRSWSRERGNSAAILAMGPDGLDETLAVWDTSLAIDNFEGIAVREEGEDTFLYIVSDNNFSDDQRTLLMKFEVSRRAATAPGVPPKVYATEVVVLETTMGDITVSLETERAPITAANFLRYVDEDRFDGAKCYRAMRVTGGQEPSGFLQCGAQNDPRRILDGITHEPTNETGLSHTDGALSMARFEPGSATGDFSIMIRDQRGLDAYPESEDPGRRPGFAVFGYVVDGMDVVHAIHATPTDPEKGEGFLKGQMLTQPVEIVNVRRAEAAE
uniref:esterase-like activity of phytase family protein n=1 Tax=uncultured Altererythrobacter sp. TaxID=500840 RepID=UPI002633A70C|nr:esterase-like activity of phytase family protein [uncultured Altererythrobacter sp.]